MARQLTYYTQKLDVNLSNCFELCILFPSLHISSVRPLPQSNHTERLGVWSTNSCRQILANGSLSLRNYETQNIQRNFKKSKEIQRNLSKSPLVLRIDAAACTVWILRSLCIMCSSTTMTTTTMCRKGNFDILEILVLESLTQCLPGVCRVSNHVPRHHRSCCTTSQTSPKSVEMLCGCVGLDQEPKMLNQNIYALWTCINNYQNKYPRTFLYSTYSYTFIYIICLYFAYFCILQYSSAYYTRFIMSL